MKSFIHAMIVASIVAVCLACAAVRHHHNSKLHLPGVITTTEFSEPILLPGHGDVVYVTFHVKDQALFDKVYAQKLKEAEERVKNPKG